MLRTLTITGLALAGVTAMASQPPIASLAGGWAGDRMQLTITPEGAHIEMDCASGAITGPIRLDAKGRFSARGTFDPHRGGPQRADEGLVPAKPGVRYSGTVKNDVLKLSVLETGARTPQIYTLRKGARLKLIRCL